jgi:hypothetical protein
MPQPTCLILASQINPCIHTCGWGLAFWVTHSRWGLAVPCISSVAPFLFWLLSFPHLTGQDFPLAWLIDFSTPHSAHFITLYVRNTWASQPGAISENEGVMLSKAHILSLMEGLVSEGTTKWLKMILQGRLRWKLGLNLRKKCLKRYDRTR